MPNHITNVLRITAFEHRGAAISLVDEALAAIKGATPFDFNRILPMPEDLNIVSGGQATDAIVLISDHEAKTMLSYPWTREARITSVDGLREHLRKRYAQRPLDGFQTLDDLAARIISNREKYGTADWYEWCTRKWGTKWNAYSVTASKTDDHEAVVHFETAWAPPMPVLDELARRFPALNFRLMWCDEGDDLQHRVYWEAGKREFDEGDKLTLSALGSS